MAGVVRARGMTPPGGRGLPPLAPGENGEKSLAQQIFEVDGGQCRRRQVLRGVDAERDVGVVLLQGHRADLPDLDTGDADRVAGLQLGRVGELGHVPCCRLRVHVEQRRDDDRGEDEGDDGEDDDLDHGAGQPRMAMVRSHERVTRASRTGESNSVDTAGEAGAEPLTAVTIFEMARVCAGSATTGVGSATVESEPPDGDRALSVTTVSVRGVGRWVHVAGPQPGGQVGGRLRSTQHGEPEVGRIGDDLGLGQVEVWARTISAATHALAQASRPERSWEISRGFCEMAVRNGPESADRTAKGCWMAVRSEAVWPARTSPPLEGPADA